MKLIKFLFLIINLFSFHANADEVFPLELEKVDRLQWYGNIFKMEMGPLDMSNNIRYRILYMKEEAYLVYFEKLYEDDEGLIRLRDSYFVNFFDVLKNIDRSYDFVTIDFFYWISESVIKVKTNKGFFIIYSENDKWFVTAHPRNSQLE